MYCRSCGESLIAGTKFCGKCGAVVEVTASEGIRCPTCGAVNKRGAKFCRQDGTPLADAPATSHEPRAVPPVAERVASPVAPIVRPVSHEPPPAEPAPALRPVRAEVAQASGGGGASRLWLAVGALAVLAAAGGGYWYYKSRGASPQAVETAQAPASQTPKTAVAPEPEGDVLEVQPSTAQSGTPSSAQSQAADAPQVSVGDRWVTEVVDHQDAKLNYRAERTVTGVGNDRIVTSVRTVGKDYVRSVEYSGQWALIATHLPSGATTTYSPALPYLSFPLEQGKSWQASVVETDAEGKQRVHDVKARMESWETVQVPAGTFKALKVVLTDDISKDGVVVQQGQDVSWYAPEARRTVKTEETSFDPGTGERRRRTISLVEYSLQSAQSSVGAAEGELVGAAVDLSGEAVYKSACVACHGAGIAGAPRFGDKASWAARIAQGTDVLYAHALQGYQGTSGYMPPKGGRTDLSDRSVVNTVDYMIAAVPPSAAPSPAEPVTRGSTASGSAPLSLLPGHVSLILAFAADSWVEITDGSGKVVLYDLGRAGTQRKIAAAAPLSVTVGNGPAVTALVNGQPVAIPAPPAGATVVRFRVEEDGALR